MEVLTGRLGKGMRQYELNNIVILAQVFKPDC
jgi:hypothetical protein